MTGLGIEYSPCTKCDKTKCSFCELAKYKNSQKGCQPENRNGIVEVVRCSECAYCAENICPITGQKMYFCAYHPNNYPVTLTHYCGHGERKVE